MALGTVVNLSPAGGWVLPSTGFVNPSYIGPPDPTLGIGTSTGFMIEPGGTLTVSFEGTYSGLTLTHQQTLDETGVNGWFNVAGSIADGSGTGGTGASTSGAAYVFGCTGNLHRINVTALSTGSVKVRASFDSYSSAVAVVSGPGGTVAAQVQGNVASGATDSGNPVRVGGKYNASAPTFTDGQRGDLQITASGKLATAVDGVADNVTTSGTATSAAVLMTLSTTGYGSGSLQIISSGTNSSITGEGSNDGGTTWQTIELYAESGIGAVNGWLVSTTPQNLTAGSFFLFKADFAQVRFRVSTYGSGTVSATATLKRASPPDMLPMIAQGISSLNNGSPGQSTLSAIYAFGTGNNANRLLTAKAATATTGDNILAVTNMSGAPITADGGNKANAIGTATLAAAAGKTTYITGFSCTASGATGALVVTVVLSGIVTGSMNYTFVYPAGVTTAASPLIVQFPTPIAASAANTAIVVTMPASGSGGTNATVNAHGFQL